VAGHTSRSASGRKIAEALALSNYSAGPGTKLLACRPSIQLIAKGAITFKDGQVEQRNFHDFTPAYMKDSSVAVDVHIVPSNEQPSGGGEPPVPVISPAVVNALYRLTGKRYRSLPLKTLDLRLTRESAPYTNCSFYSA